MSFIQEAQGLNNEYIKRARDLLHDQIRNIFLQDNDLESIRLIIRINRFSNGYDFKLESVHVTKYIWSSMSIPLDGLDITDSTKHSISDLVIVLSTLHIVALEIFNDGLNILRREDYVETTRENLSNTLC
jgi:hypothetical protein